MKLNLAIPAIAATLALGGASVASAQSVQGNVNKTLGAGVAGADRDGAFAGGLTAGGSAQVQKNKDRRDRGQRRGEQQAPALGNSSSTYGSGAVHTSRRNSSAAVTSGASASGSGVQSTGTTIDAYGETTRQGSSADIYGDSTASSGERPRRR